jgi:hypothetical protein
MKKHTDIGDGFIILLRNAALVQSWVQMTSWELGKR